MEIQHFSHEHPLVFSEEPRYESDENAYCFGCGEAISGPRFSCVACRFHLDKNCAEAPSEIDHPFHRDHGLKLLASSPYAAGVVVNCLFCDEFCNKFSYHCSCRLDLHIKCALFSLNLAKNNIGDQLQHFAQKNPSISTENHSVELKKAKCFACRKPLLDSIYLSLDFGFYLHKICVELPLEINRRCHRPHSLILQFNNTGYPPCQIRLEPQDKGLVYCCSICKFVIHIECEPFPPVIEVTTSHEHPFTRLLLRQSSFTCDACGTLGNSVSYNCSTCNLIVHKRCTSLPDIIKSIWHHHPISHKYFVVDDECGTLECVVCHEIVNIECGSYHCSKCKFILHVNCALKHDSLYYKIESINAYENALVVDTMDQSFDVIQWNEREGNVINTEIKHFSHEHSLVLVDEVKGYMYCDGCSSRLIATSFYCCSQCNFFLHKSCAELPRKKEIWYHPDQLPFNLVPCFFFNCLSCDSICSGFAYQCQVCHFFICIRCTEISQVHTSQAHKHPLHYYNEYNGQCNACGGVIASHLIYRCKACDFNVHTVCALLPQIALHICDEHFLSVTYFEDSNYAEYLYCDICEEKRNPNNWFYYCAICDTSAHSRCVLGDYPFIKFGTKCFIQSQHQHPLVLVQKDCHHPKCFKCGKPCLDLALECAETRCNYIVHLSCIPYSYVWYDL